MGHVSDKGRATLAGMVSLAIGLTARATTAQTSAQPAAPAHARATLDYAAPAELACPDRDAFASAIATRVGYDAIVPEAGADTKTLRVKFRAEKTAVHVTLQLTGTTKAIEAEKSLVSESGGCADLAGAAAFAAAILLDPRAMFPRPTKPAAPGESLESNAAGTWPWYEPRSPLPKEAPPPPPSPAPLRWRAGVAAATCAGCAPSTSFGGALFVGLARDHLGLDLGVRADLPDTSSGPSGRELRSSLVVGELFPHARLGILRLGLLGSFGALVGDSDGESQTSPFAAAGVRAGLEWRVAGPVFMRLALDGSLALARVSLRVEGRELWSTPAVTGGASLAGGVEF